MRPHLAFLLLIGGLSWANTAAAQDLPGVNLEGLEADEKAALSGLMKDGACPCDPKLSLLQCITAKSCPKATELANYGATKFREGEGAEQVQEAVVKKYLNDHVTYTFDLTGTPQKGAKQGRIAIVEFADFECPHCAMIRPIMSEVVKKFPKDVTLYFKPFPLNAHNFGEPGARATLAAHAQGRFWEMHDFLFENQGRVDLPKVEAFALELGLNLERFKKDMQGAPVTEMIQRDRQEAMQANLSGTPTIYINGKLYLDDKSTEALTAYIQALLTKK